MFFKTFNLILLFENISVFFIPNFYYSYLFISSYWIFIRPANFFYPAQNAFFVDFQVIHHSLVYAWSFLIKIIFELCCPFINLDRNSILLIYY